MSPRFVEVENVDEIVDEVVEHISQPQRRRRRHKGPEQTRNLLHQETVLMTVLAQDPIVVNRAGPIVDQIPVPADRVQLGPRNHRFHVVDISVNTDGRGKRLGSAHDRPRLRGNAAPAPGPDDAGHVDWRHLLADR
jgi:hypothetical protein